MCHNLKITNKMQMLAPVFHTWPLPIVPLCVAPCLPWPPGQLQIPFLVIYCFHLRGGTDGPCAVFGVTVLSSRMESVDAVLYVRV